MYAGVGAPVNPTPQANLSAENSVLEKFFRPSLDTRYTYDQDANFSSGHGSLSLQEAEVLLPLHSTIAQDFVLRFDLQYRFYQMQVETHEFLADFDLHSARVPIEIWKFTESPWFIYSQLQPGISTDFNSGSDGSFDLNTSVAIGYRFSGSLVLAAGVYYTRDYGEDMVLPVLGMLWRPTEQLSCMVGAAGGKFTYEYGSDWRFNLKAVPYGGRWIIDQSGSELKLTGAKVGIDLERRLFGHAWLSLGVGLNVLSNLEIEGKNGRESFDRDLDASMYVISALRWRF